MSNLSRYLADRDVRCPGCGYNLRGLEEGTCPECGFGVNLEALRELDRRQRFKKAWRHAAALEYSWLGAGAMMMVCALLVHWGLASSQRPAWLSLFQITGERTLWTVRRTGWLHWWGLLAVAFTAWAHGNSELIGPGVAKASRVAVWLFLGAHVIAAVLAFIT